MHRKLFVAITLLTFLILTGSTCRKESLPDDISNWYGMPSSSARFFTNSRSYFLILIFINSNYSATK